MKKKLYVLLCVCLLVAGALQVSAAGTSYSSITNDEIKKKEQQISTAQTQKKELQNRLSDMQKIKKDLENKKNDLQKYVTQLDRELESIEQNIRELKSQIGVKEEEIEVAAEDLARAQDLEDTQRAAMIVRIRAMYEQGDTYMDALFSQSRSVAEFMNRAKYMERIRSYDQRQYDEFKASRIYTELCKEQLELEKEILDETKAQVEEEQKNLEELIAKKEKDLLEYESDITDQDKKIKEYQQMVAEQNAEIEALEKLIAEEKRRIIAANGVVLNYDGGTFKFPMATYTRVSDDYGDRIHPTLKVKQFHNGVDLTAPKGTAIYAAYDGVVVAATYSATMGNYIMIDHGGGLYTIYMHASALYVKKDDVVVRGDTIAAVGSTGRSTGNHLHFSVRLDGEYVSPWNYISKK